jgi:EF hand
MAYTTISGSVPAGSAPHPSLAPTAAPAAPIVDTVTLSPDAQTAATSTGAGTPVSETEAPVGSATDSALSDPPATATEGRAEALFKALDADQDGSITAQEFTEGSLALLRRAGERHHHRQVHDDDRRDHGERGHHHLERNLERLFERVDSNDDGSVDQTELTAALTKIRGRERHEARLRDFRG